LLFLKLNSERLKNYPATYPPQQAALRRTAADRNERGIGLAAGDRGGDSAVGCGRASRIQASQGRPQQAARTARDSRVGAARL
jgi:hypothetical protein